MKRTLIFVIIVLPTFAVSQIPISTIEELQKIGNEPSYPLDGDYYLAFDIDATRTREWNGGKGFHQIAPVSKFTGNFDGKGHTIRNLYINRPEDEGVGLFSWTQEATVENIRLEDVNITGKRYVGGLIGYSSSTIKNVEVSGSVKGASNIGGIAGARFGKIIKCRSSCIVTGEDYIGGIIGWNQTSVIESYCSGNIKGGDSVGGVAGWSSGWLIDCFSSAIVESNTSHVFHLGGLVGLNYSIVENCHATGPVSGEGSVGGLIGASISFYHDEVTYEVIDSFYDTDTTGQFNSWMTYDEKGIPKHTDEMTSPGTFTNWDFENVWWMIPGKTYPLLRPVWFVDADLKPADWMPVPKYGFPLEFDIKFGEPVKNFTFEDIDFTSSTIENLTGELVMDDGTTWTLRITDTATTTPVFPAEIVLRLPVAAGINAANYPTTETAAIKIPFHASVPGDLNGDGLCNAKDSDILAEWIVTPSSPWRSRLSDKMPDLNKDAKIDSADLVTLLALWSK